MPGRHDQDSERHRPQVHSAVLWDARKHLVPSRSSSTLSIPTRISSLGSMTVEVRSSLLSLDRRDTRIESVCKIFQFLVTHHGPVAFSHRAEREFFVTRTCSTFEEPRIGQIMDSFFFVLFTWSNTHVMAPESNIRDPLFGPLGLLLMAGAKFLARMHVFKLFLWRMVVLLCTFPFSRRTARHKSRLFGSVASHPLEALRRLQVVDRTAAANLHELLRRTSSLSLASNVFDDKCRVAMTREHRIQELNVALHLIVLRNLGAHPWAFLRNPRRRHDPQISLQQLRLAIDWPHPDRFVFEIWAPTSLASSASLPRSFLESARVFEGPPPLGPA